MVVGATEGVSYGKAAPGDSWRDVFLKEIEESSIRVACISRTASLRARSCSCSNSVPAMCISPTPLCSVGACWRYGSGCAVVGSATAPVQEVITHGQEGLLVDFFSPEALADSVDFLLRDRALARELGQRAQDTVVRRFGLQACVPRQLALMQLVASGALSGG